MDEVELNITPAADLLPCNFLLAIFFIFSFGYYRKICRHECIAIGLLKTKQLICMSVISRSKVFIKNAADAAHFLIAMSIGEIIITLLFIHCMQIAAKRIDRIF